MELEGASLTVPGQLFGGTGLGSIQYWETKGTGFRPLGSCPISTIV